MTDIEEKLITQARKMHKEIYPCPQRGSFERCFTKDSQRIYFWFNTEDQSTHVVTADVNK